MSANQPNQEVIKKAPGAPLTQQRTQFQRGITRNYTDVNVTNDDSIIDLDYEKNLTKIDYPRMLEVMKERHVTKDNKGYYQCDDVCYKFDPGSHYCSASSEKTDLQKFGVGITLYFKFIKHMIFFFFIFTILSLPAYIFYCAAFATYTKSKSNESLSYIDLLTATTVGSVGLGSTSCGLSKYPSTTQTIYFECASGGTIADVDNVIYGLVSAGKTCNFVDTNDLALLCNRYDTTSSNALTTAFSTASCVGQTSCNLTIPSTIFLSTGTYTYCDALYNSRNVYMQVSCTTTSLTIFNNYKISKTTVAFVVATLDAVIILIFLLMIYTLKFAQKSATQNIQKKSYSASSYTVEIRNLPQEMPAEELASKLWSFMDNKLGQKANAGGHRVVDVQIVLPNRLIECSKNLGDIIHKKNTLIRQFMQLYVPDYTKHTIEFRELQSVMVHLRQKNPVVGKEADKLYRKIKDMVVKKEKLLLEIKKLKTSKHIRIVSAFVTLSSIPAKQRILSAFASSPIDRFFRIICSCCYEKDSSFYGKMLQARSADDPGSILWENLGEPGTSIFARRALSALLTVVLWVISGAILIFSTYEKNYFKASYPQINCSGRNPTLATTTTDFLLGDLQVGLLQCYCSADIINRFYDVFTGVNNRQLCMEWFRDKVIETSITFAIVFIVLVVNYMIQFVFQGLSKFEKHSTLNKQLATRVLKTFVAQFLNTGLMILIVNIRFDISFWQGQFRDISPLWYENVGSTLLSTMFINIITVPAIKLAGLLFVKMLQCCDRGCSSDKSKTKKKTQAKYEDLYTGPEFIIDFRYSQILTFTFVCFLYSGGMPLLYFTSLLQLIVTYFFDKFLLLRVSRLPKNYDEKLETVVRPTLYFILIGHLIFTIFMFGNSQIFNQSISIFSSLSTSISKITDKISSESESVVTKFFKRAVLDYNMILFIVLLALLAIFLVKGVLLGFLSRTVFAVFSKGDDFTEEGKKKGKKVAPETLPNYTFFHVIKTEDLEALIRLTKITIKSTQNEDLIKQYKTKLALLKQEYQIKKSTPEDPTINFIGFYTYDVRLHPSYKAQFAIEEVLNDESLN